MTSSVCSKPFLTHRGKKTKQTRARNKQAGYHGIVLLLERGGVDDAPQQPAVADGVLLALVPLEQQLVVQQEQLAAQRVQFVQRCGA